MASLKAPLALPKLVKSAFERARSDGELLYYPTQVAILNVHGIPYQLRFSPALAKKPKGPPKDASKQTKPFDPFADPPAALRITDLGPSHFLVLNKFAIVPEHFILATTEFKLQTHLLEEADLDATLACIQAYEEAKTNSTRDDENVPQNDGLFAFFNCGDHSGASQPHRHIQLLPIARMRDGLDPNSDWSVLADSLTSRTAPFTTFAEKISLEMPRSEVHAAYLRLYRQACRAVSAHTDADTIDDGSVDGETRISYNLALTKDTLVVCPRVAEGADIHGREGEALGTLSLNGTVLAGTALVKNEVEWEALRNEPELLLQVLTKIGLSD